MLYVLGAAQGRLGHHLELASHLYLRGLARTIYILDRPGITEYSPALNRNLTNNEWAVAKLEKLGVLKKDIGLHPFMQGLEEHIGKPKRSYSLRCATAIGS
jgi:hypothetical protein